jgi:hypothetical protein
MLIAQIGPPTSWFACMHYNSRTDGYACKVRLSQVTRRGAVNHRAAEGSKLKALHTISSTMTRTTLFLATVALSASTALPRPALKPTLKLRGGELPPRPALYGAPGDKTSRGLTFTFTTTGTTVQLVVLGSGIVGLHAISFDRLIATLPGPLRLVFFIGVILHTPLDFESLWPQRTVGRLIVSALSASILFYASFGRQGLVALPIVALLAVASHAYDKADQCIGAKLRGLFKWLALLVAFYLVGGLLSPGSLPTVFRIR